MPSITMVFRTEMRRRWLSWFALALLVAFISGTVLAGAPAGRRTSSALPHFTARYGYDAQVFSSSPLAKGFADLPYVTSFTPDLFYANGNVIAGGQFVPANDIGIFGLPSAHLTNTVKLVSGRLPVDPTRRSSAFRCSNS